jgi:hypothetical protein
VQHLLKSVDDFAPGVWYLFLFFALGIILGLGIIWIAEHMVGCAHLVQSHVQF